MIPDSNRRGGGQERWRKILFLLLCLATMSVAVPVQGAARQRVAGGTLTIALAGSPPTLNTALAALPLASVPGAQLFASLFRLDRSFAPKPYLASRWRLSQDGRSLTVELVKGALFHDGRPITSRDVAFSIEAARDHHSFSTMLAAVERVETPAKHTVLIRLRHPHPALFVALSAPLTPILPAHVYGDGQPFRSHPANLAPVGSGPFRFMRWEPGGKIILKRFENFFRPGRPFLDGLEFVLYPDPGLIPPVLASGEAHLSPLLPTYTVAPLAATNPGLTVTPLDARGAGLFLNAFTFNLRRPPFADPRVRRAIASAIDRDHLYNALLKGKLEPADGPFPPDHPFAYRGGQRDRNDLPLANRLLDEAGYPRNREGLRFRVELLVPLDESMIEATAEYLRWSLRRSVGIDFVPVVAKSIPAWLQRMAAGDFDMSLDIRLMWGDPVMGLHRTYLSNDKPGARLLGNYAGYSNPEVDKLLDAAARESDPERRRQLYRNFQEKVADDLPYLWLANTPLSLVASKELILSLDSPWPFAEPYDEAHWQRRPARNPVSRALPGQSSAGGRRALSAVETSR